MRWLVTLTLLAVVVVIWYYMDSNKPSETDGTKSSPGVREVDKILNKDLEESYPYTAREVVQLFVRIQKCYYKKVGYLWQIRFIQLVESLEAVDNM